MPNASRSTSGAESFSQNFKFVSIPSMFLTINLMHGALKKNI